MADDVTLTCWNCARAITTLVLPLGRRSDCPHCYAELHCCRMCRHFRPDRRPDQCAEDERAEVPTNKESANFCDFFALVEGDAGTDGADKAAQARAELEALFGGKGDG